MIDIKVKILSVGSTNGGFITEDAAKSMVERFNKRPEKLFVRIDKSPIIVGEVSQLEYDDTNKVVNAMLIMNLDFTTGGRVLQSLETPQGKRILDCELLVLNALLRNIQYTTPPQQNIREVNEGE